MAEYRTQFTLSFTLPLITNLAGVELWQAYDSSTGAYAHVDTKLMAQIPTSGGLYYYTYTTSTGNADGRSMYYKIKYFTTTNIFSSLSNSTQIITVPTPATQVVSWWNGLDSTVEWELVPTSSGQNFTVNQYAIVRKELNLLSGHVFTATNSSTGIITNPLFIINSAMLVLHPGTETYWYGILSSTGTFTINSSNMILGGETTLNYANIQSSDIVVYYNLIPTISDIIGTTLPNINIYIDTTPVFDTRYIYGVITRDTINNRNSLASIQPTITKNLALSIPRVRRLGDSGTTYLNKDQNLNWIGMKNALIDENFYDKEANAIPYSTSKTNFKGWVGVGRILVDVYQNNKYILTTTTGIYGDLSADLLLDKDKNGVGLNVIKLRARNGSISSKFSSVFTYNVYNMYTIFAAWGESLNDFNREMLLVKSDLYLTTARSDALENNFGSVVELNKQTGWTTEVYRTVLQKIWNAYDFSATEKGLVDIVTAFPEVEHVDFFPRFSNRTTYRTGVTYVGSPALSAGDYTYGVAAQKTTGELTPPTTLRLDRRWWPPAYDGVNILNWEGVSSANGYVIYRQDSSSGMIFLTSTAGTIFFDDGSIFPFGPSPLTLNYSGMDLPQNLVEEVPFISRDIIFKKKNVHGLQIVVFGYSGEPISTEKQNLITSFILKIIPSSIKTIITYTS